MPDEFQQFGLSHLGAIMVSVGLAGLLILWGRHWPNQAQAIGCGWALVLVLDDLIYRYWYLHHMAISWTSLLPMHLCDWALVVAIVTLISRGRLTYELAYFWGLAGTLQAVITPDLKFDFPRFGYFNFFLSHCGVLVAVAYATWAYHLRPSWKSVLRAFLWGQLFLVSAGVVDVLTGENFGYLRAKPAQASLLDYLGPWPWYILSLQVVGLLSFVVYYLPWVFYDAFYRSSDYASKKT